ncbi:MAG: glutamate formimidoyltransferase [Methanoregulaceae archaeon]|nr:glutamate formimidoyltransferase [Methanoregulaceae archaeon]
MAKPILECVPNFSEGRDRSVLDAIAEAARSVDGVKLLDVDPGASTNRTVFTFAGDPDAVVEAAVRAARAGTERIDMRCHTGEHPRFGALDVCPLVPISGMSMDETVVLARKLGARLAEEVGLTIYLYGYAASLPERADLSVVRAGEYEGLEAKLRDPAWAPDYGPAEFNPMSGATAVSARDILVAYNINLNTTSVRRANSVAFDVREKGRVKRLGDPINGEIVKDADGNPVSEPGALKHVKAIGWFIEEYGFAQVSMNLTNIRETPVHVAFDTTCDKAHARGIRVTGSELVGLIPLGCLLDAGRYFLTKQQRSVGVSNAELIKVAVKTMGLDELGPFDVRKRVIEYTLEEDAKRLVDMTLRAFTEETASESPAPGGGSISAAMGAMGAALATMVANLSSHKRGWDDRWEEFSSWAELGKGFYDRLLVLIDEDTAAFNRLMDAFGLPKNTPEEKAARSAAIQAATKGAIEIPLQVMQLSCDAMGVVRTMAEHGNPNSVSDVGVGALALRSAVLGAHLNVKINASSIKDEAYRAGVLATAAELAARVVREEAEVLAIVESKV